MRIAPFTYDVETDSKFAPYANLTVIGILYMDTDEEIIYEAPFSPEEKKELRELFSSPVEKIGFNNCNYDDLVLYQHGFPVNEEGRQDGFLAAKTVFPELPAFSLKFLNWWFFGDFHMPEYALEQSQKANKKGRFEDADPELLVKYNSHDLFQHKRWWNFVRPIILSNPEHIRAYALDMSVGKPVEQMIFEGGLYINRELCEHEVATLQGEREALDAEAWRLSGGRVTNPASVRQLGFYYDEEGHDLELTDNGNFVVDKALIRILADKNKDPLAKVVQRVRENNSKLKYYRNYLAALEDPIYRGRGDWIPISVGISSAKTRRFTSSSKYKLNFQNSSYDAKKALIIPPGMLGWWMDATQIENVVHIFESNDTVRRIAYEGDENWSEYVWLCNEVLGGNYTKDELEAMQSEQNALWTVYKQYKTVKLMLNFGAGVKKFAEVTGFTIAQARKIFADIHRACPAIKSLQDRVCRDIVEKGEVYDVFGHVYRGNPDQAYKIVAYLIQGCGTGSLPKAQLRAHYDTLKSWEKKLGRPVGYLSVTTHDEHSGYLYLDLGEEIIDQIISELNYNMTKRFESFFDGIPLRSKTYLSTKNFSDRKEVKTYAEYLQSI